MTSLLRLLGEDPRQLVIQYTDRCNAHCPQCGMRVTERFERSVLPKQTVMRILEAAARRGVQSVSFTGGEPLLYLGELAELVSYARSAGIRYTRTGTNGSPFLRPEGGRGGLARIAETLAKSGLYTFWISLDSSCAAVHDSLRGFPGLTDAVAAAVPVLHEHGVYPSANLSINRGLAGKPPPPVAAPVEFYEFFKEAFGRLYERAIEMGFTLANTCYPMSLANGDGGRLSAVYAAASRTPLVSFSSEEKALIFRALFETIAVYRSKIRIFSPRSALYALMRQYTVGPEYCFPCRGGVDFFFVDAKGGDTYPCGFRGNENLGKFWDLKEAKGETPSCRRCDWECFRDPSELAGPLLSFKKMPLRFLRRAVEDRAYMRLWLEDLRYFRACGLFDCGRPPDYRALARFQAGGA